jgi:quercetin dioxygenase-like cupin family protein
MECGHGYRHRRTGDGGRLIGAIDRHEKERMMAELIDFGSFQVNFLRDKFSTGGAVDVFELILSPEGRMPLPHYHMDWEETVYGIDGVVTYTIDGVAHHVEPGGSAFVPRGVVHGFSNPTETTAKCLCVLTPGKLGPEYFEELAAEIRTGAPRPAVMGEIMQRYGLIPG